MQVSKNVFLKLMSFYKKPNTFCLFNKFKLNSQKLAVNLYFSDPADRFSKFKLFVFKEIVLDRIFFTKYDDG